MILIRRLVSTRKPTRWSLTPRSTMESAAAAEEAVLLHGDLLLGVVEAASLPNMDSLSELLRLRFTSCHAPFTRSAPPSSGDAPVQQMHLHRNNTSDPYVTVSLAGATVARTRVISNAQDPVWKEQFKIPVAHRTSALELKVKDKDVFSAQLIGTVSIPAARIAAGEKVEGWFPIVGPNGEQWKPETKLHLSLKYTPVEEKPEYQHGIAGDPEKLGVRDTYFPVRPGGSVTLYQDAHVKDGDLPEVTLENGAIFKQEKCWEDICLSILEAHHSIYIVGWSIYHKVRLVREPTRPIPSAGELTLGELLKYKSQEGVRVCVLVWDDKTSHDNFFIKKEGVMQTHDEETRKFFKHSSVICVLSPRYASTKLSIVKQQVVGILFSHHQKCVLVDTQASGNKRKITAFIGGLDLCDGRYDTPEHRLFRNLDTTFANDLRNPTFSAGTKGPRQPWHDLHCKIEGPAAHDILKNFEQRWQKATKWQELSLRIKRSIHWHDDSLIKLERIPWILSPSKSVPEDDPSLWVSREKDSENWHVQVFRSIDSGSATGFPNNVHEASKLNLVCQKNLIIDKSIHTAYVEAIRSAQHFIYIESQYFLGSSYAWPSKLSGAENLIPMELALKVASKIRANERFSVYVVIPMWPEGDPNSNAMQEILYWQGQTIQMMYEIVAQELRTMKLENVHPQEYLNFYCLGNREEVTKDDSEQDGQTLENGSAALSQKFRRFMIYVHAKGMIVDDEYVIVGSANINQRSMAGSRDTEIAMGAYQPHYSWANKKRRPHGQVYGYRMSLWSEHLGMVDDRFEEPKSLECVKFVNKIAEENWSRYTAEEITPLTGHLLKYPIKVEDDGKVGPLPDYECFPDVGGKILGVPTALPDTLTM